MPASSPSLTDASSAGAVDIGTAVRERRKSMGISATAAAEAAGISRPTWHRIERGEPSVTLGAYMQATVVLGLALSARPREDAPAPLDAPRPGWLPARVRITDFPGLRQLAWQLHGPQELTPREALGIYERNMRHLDLSTLSSNERDLIDALRLALGNDVEKARDV